MTDRIEVDYAQLQQVTKTLQRRADELAQQYNAIINKGRELNDVWQGKAADEFFDEMSDRTLPAMRRLIESLDKTESALNRVMDIYRQAEEQASNLFKAGAFGGSSTGANANGGGAGGTPEYKDGDLYGTDHRPFTGKPDVIFIPGINTDPKGFEGALARTDARFDGNVAAIYNKTDGMGADILQAMGDISQAEINMRLSDNPAVVTLSKQIEQAMKEGRPLTLEAHSQGGAITSAALMKLYRENPNLDLSKLTVNTYGSAGTEFPPGPKYTHYVIAVDPVPLLGNIGGLGGSLNYYAHVVLLPPSVSTAMGGDIVGSVHGMDSYYSAIDKGYQAPSISQVVEGASEMVNQVVDTGAKIFNYFMN